MSIRNAVLTACMAAAVASSLIAGPRPPSPRPTITFSDLVDVNNIQAAPPLFHGDGIGSYIDGSDGVAVTLQSIGDIQLDTRSSTTRGVWLNFGSHAGTSGSLPGDKTIVKRVLMTSHCYNTPGATPLNKMTTVGQDSVCSMTLRYDNDTTASTYYRLGFNTEKRGTEYVSFNCDEVTGGFCSQWTATPADNNNPGGSADSRSNAAVIPVTESKRDGQVEGPWLADAVPFIFQFTFRK